MKNSKLKFSEYMQNISRAKSFGKFVLIVRYFFITCKSAQNCYNLNPTSITCKQYLKDRLYVDQWLMELLMIIFLNLHAKWYDSFNVQKKAIYESDFFVNLILKNLKTGYIPNTNRIQANIHISIAVKPSAFGEFVVMLLKILIKTRNSVMSNAILPEDLK